MDTIFTQDSRLLAIRLPADSDIQQGDLLLHRLEAQEALGAEGSDLFHCQAACYSSNSFIELKDLLGQPVELSILQSDDSYRLVSGIIAAATHQGSDGGFTLFGLRIVSAFAILAQRRNCRVFQDMTVPAIVEQIFQEHIAANPVFAKCLKFTNKLIKNYPSRSYCTQLYESDARFIARLLAEEGVSSLHLHGDGDLDSANTSDSSSADRTDPITHQFVLVDDNSTYPTGTADSVSFHAVDATSDEDSIFDFTATRQITASNTSFASYEYKSMAISTTNEGTWIQQGDAGSDVASTLEDYSGQTLYYGQDQSDLDRYTVLRQQAKDVTAKLWHGQSTVRNFTVGSKVTVNDHPVLDQGPAEDRDFLIRNLSYTAVNNLSKDELSIVANISGTAHSGSSKGDNPYVNHFTAIRSSIPFVPAYTEALARPVAKGMGTAIVVGPSGEEIFTDSLGRICVQLHWQRTQDHPGGGANYDDKSSTWVRVVMPAAGGNFGQQMIPRVGQEVLIGFLHNDPDRLMCLGVVHTGLLTPPTFSGVGSLPANKTLAGIKTKEYQGTGYNELLFDDTTGQLRTKLSSEAGKTQLNMGFLIHPRTDGKGEQRGNGYDLRTDWHGAVRAAHGLLISADARSGAAGKQIDRQEALGQLQSAQSLAQTLGDVASKQLANLPETGKDNKLVKEDKVAGETKEQGHQRHLVQAIEAWEQGTNTEKSGKVPAENKQAGQQGAILLSAPAGIAAATPNSMTIATGTNLDQIAQRDTNQTSGRRWVHNAGESISHFVQGVKDKISLKLIAAKGKVQVQAQAGEVEVTGDQSLTITSVKDSIHVNAKKEILLVCGGAYIRIADGNIEVHAPKKTSIKGVNKIFGGSANMKVPMPELPQLIVHDQQIAVKDKHGNILKNMPFTVKLPTGEMIQGYTDEEGKTGRYLTYSSESIKYYAGHVTGEPKSDT